MPFSEFLSARRERCHQLVDALSPHSAYVSILGSDVRSKSIGADRRSTDISEGNMCECGFVVKLHDGGAFYEYSLDEIGTDIDALADRIRTSVAATATLSSRAVSVPVLEDAPLVQSFVRESDDATVEEGSILDFCMEMRDMALGMDDHLVNFIIHASSFTVNKLFVSKNRDLDQTYSWVNMMAVGIYQDGDKMVQSYDGSYGSTWQEAKVNLPARVRALVNRLPHLAQAKPITPGVYDCITDSSISGLIAHEAFGHGVEMDQFVKDRAQAKHFVGKRVASPICNMRDGAASALSTASYFFDDDGVLAHDTQIIRDGILVAGISDLASAAQLGTEPTGNGRRESYKRKAYARMTNTFFDKGTDKLEDMIASIQHGYMLFQTNNGMEDPKNWQIQCTAEYGIEIVDGKLTDNYVTPVVMSGYVPDLLKSISMVSDECRVIGSGGCGKGYKEWVRVSDGGPALKVRVKLA